MGSIYWKKYQFWQTTANLGFVQGGADGNTINIFNYQLISVRWNAAQISGYAISQHCIAKMPAAEHQPAFVFQSTVVPAWLNATEH